LASSSVLAAATTVAPVLTSAAEASLTATVATSLLAVVRWPGFVSIISVLNFIVLLEAATASTTPSSEGTALVVTSTSTILTSLATATVGPVLLVLVVFVVSVLVVGAPLGLLLLGGLAVLGSISVWLCSLVVHGLLWR